jgi:hypothetical protein
MAGRSAFLAQKQKALADRCARRLADTNPPNN